LLIVDISHIRREDTPLFSIASPVLGGGGSGKCNIGTDDGSNSTAATYPYKKLSYIADKPRDAFRGQSRSPNTVLFDM